MNPEESQTETNEKFSERNGVLVQVDHDICAGFGECVNLLPDVFALNDEGLAVVLDADAVELDMLKEAADVCPVSAILLLDEDENQIAPEL
jgi:ferredoxin